MRLKNYSIGFLADDNKLAWKSYKERADLARKRGIELFFIAPRENLASDILKRKKISTRFWDGKSMQEREIEIPKVIYDRLNISNKKRKELVSAFEEREAEFINPPSFREACADKVETYYLFFKAGLPTPETHVFSAECLEDILERKGFVFVKKRISSQGRNQVVIRELGREDFLIIPSYNNQLQRVNGLRSVLNYLSELGVGEDYLVQEGINVDRLDGRAYDFRAIFQRGSQGHLGMTCFYVRVGAPSSEQANIGKKGHPQDPCVVFEDYEKLKQDINKLGRSVVNAFSERSKIGEIGIDFVLSEEGKLVVIEANSKPGSKGLRTLREWKPTEEDYHNKGVIPYEYDNQIRGKWGKSLDQFLSRPIMYAKHLCNGIKQ
ncbi:MAG: YheC/YheD family protein [Candidatus Omnitrophica bacterium]|nr:YheC/YheD family protein [Candidatus Omnitrophota bacterium]